MKQALKNAGFKPSKRKGFFEKRLEEMPNPNNDGITHINVFNTAATNLGRRLALGNSYFVHPKLGSFNCLDAFSLLLNSKQPNDRFRYITFREARGIINKIRNHRKCAGYVGMMKDGYRHFILNNPELYKEFVESTLPFDSYQIMKASGLIARTHKANWLVDLLEELRVEFKTGKKPDPKHLPNFSELIEALTAKQEVEVKVEDTVEEDTEETTTESETTDSDAEKVGRGLTSPVQLCDELPFVATESEECNDTITEDTEVVGDGSNSTSGEVTIYAPVGNPASHEDLRRWLNSSGQGYSSSHRYSESTSDSNSN